MLRSISLKLMLAEHLRDHGCGGNRALSLTPTISQGKGRR
jgi:hypothetical protein